MRVNSGSHAAFGAWSSISSNKSTIKALQISESAKDTTLFSKRNIKSYGIGAAMLALAGLAASMLPNPKVSTESQTADTYKKEFKQCKRNNTPAGHVSPEMKADIAQRCEKLVKSRFKVR